MLKNSKSASKLLSHKTSSFNQQIQSNPHHVFRRRLCFPPSRPSPSHPGSTQVSDFSHQDVPAFFQVPASPHTSTHSGQRQNPTPLYNMQSPFPSHASTPHTPPPSHAHTLTHPAQTPVPWPYHEVREHIRQQQMRNAYTFQPQTITEQSASTLTRDRIQTVSWVMCPLIANAMFPSHEAHQFFAPLPQQSNLLATAGQIQFNVEEMVQTIRL